MQVQGWKVIRLVLTIQNTIGNEDLQQQTANSPSVNTTTQITSASSTTNCDDDQNAGASENGNNSSGSGIGVVVNELLCFCQNKMQMVNFDMLVKVCSDFYSDTQIESAKKSFF